MIMRAVQRCLLPTVLLILMLGSLLGCTQQQWWDDYASKTETLKFFTFVSCSRWFIPASPEHQVYFHATAISANADGSYRVEYQQQSEWVFEPIYFLSVLYVGLRDYTAIPVVWVPSDSSAQCAALVVLPWSSASKRPFSYQKQLQPRATAAQSLFEFSVVDVCVLIPLLLLCACAMAGYSHAERDGRVACLLSLVAVILVNAGVWWFNVLALTNIDALISFYDFYDALPKSSGHLLPLPWSQAHRLFGGPPHPASLVVDDRLFWIMLYLSCAAWLVVYARRICIGIAYAMMPDRFEELRLRLAAEGRLATADDYMGLLLQAGTTMSAWELELLKRQMKVRLPDA